jgi:UDP-N-acetylmuramoyl-tripeptide--D-alanyl-D-alanine ligase
MLNLSLTIAEMCEILDTNVIGGSKALARRKVNLCLDSREAGPGCVFWPLVGERFDAHQFITQVMENGALMSVINENQVQSIPVNVYVPVKNTGEALLRLAKGYQRRFKVKKVAITGSNGKTTTKDMMHAVLSTKYNTMATAGNLNNQVGVPMTLFRLQQSHEACIVEMGTNAIGEIKPLSVATEPHIAVITNVGYSHLEGLGTVENVYKEKVSIAKGLIHGGTLVVNADDPLLSKLRTTTHYKVVTFGIHRGQFKPQDLTWDENACACFYMGRTKINLTVPGIHNLYNALAAIAVGTLMHVPKGAIASGLANFRASRMRMEIHQCKGFKLVADCYNANPSSMRMALETIGSVKTTGRRIAILGDMLELGEKAEALHEDIGKRVLQMNFDLLCTFGKLSQGIRKGALQAGMDENHALHFEQRSDIVDYLENTIQSEDVVLVKGSRGMKLEEVVEGLKNYEVVTRGAW